LAWSSVPIAVSYNLDMGLAPGCESVFNNVSVAGTSRVSPNLADGNYCWRVQSVDVGGLVSAFSADSTFTTIPAFGSWAMVFLVATMVGGGAWFMRRRVAA
jgi:hypothetical protein